jgi:hypothetical protein
MGAGEGRLSVGLCPAEGGEGLPALAWRSSSDGGASWTDVGAGGLSRLTAIGQAGGTFVGYGAVTAPATGIPTAPTAAFAVLPAGATSASPAVVLKGPDRYESALAGIPDATGAGRIVVQRHGSDAAVVTVGADGHVTATVDLGAVYGVLGLVIDSDGVLWVHYYADSGQLWTALRPGQAPVTDTLGPRWPTLGNATEIHSAGFIIDGIVARAGISRGVSPVAGRALCSVRRSPLTAFQSIGGDRPQTVAAKEPAGVELGTSGCRTRLARCRRRSPWRPSPASISERFDGGSRPQGSRASTRRCHCVVGGLGRLAVGERATAVQLPWRRSDVPLTGRRMIGEYVLSVRSPDRTSIRCLRRSSHGGTVKLGRAFPVVALLLGCTILPSADAAKRRPSVGLSAKAVVAGASLDIEVRGVPGYVLVVWGDGGAKQGRNGRYEHAYRNPGHYKVVVTGRVHRRIVTRIVRHVTVVPPKLDISATTVKLGEAISVTSPNIVKAQTVDWGDGNRNRLAPSRSITHSYGKVGSYTVAWPYGRYTLSVVLPSGRYLWVSNGAALVPDRPAPGVVAIPSAASGVDAGMWLVGSDASATYFHPQPTFGYANQSTLGGISQAAVGSGTDYFLDTSGGVWAQGDGSRGQLGDGATGAGHVSHVPVRVEGLPKVTQIAADAWTAYALAADGTVWGWGYGYAGALGRGSGADAATPVQIAGVESAVSISSSGMAWALLASGRVMRWGCGQVSDQSGTHGRVLFSAELDPDLSNIKAINADHLGNTAITNDGAVLSWKYPMDPPQAVSGIDQAIAATPAMVLRQDGRVYVAGRLLDQPTNVIAINSAGYALAE